MLLVGVTPDELLHADLAGPIALILGSASWALGTVCGKRLGLKVPVNLCVGHADVRRRRPHARRGTREPAKQFPAQIAPGAIWAFVYLVAFGSILTFTAYTYLMRNASPTVVGTAAYINPIVAVLLGWLFLDEPITARTAAGDGHHSRLGAAHPARHADTRKGTGGRQGCRPPGGERSVVRA